MRLTDRVAIVTGAGSGIGRAIALRAAGEGAAVVVADLDPPGGRETVDQIVQTAGRAVCVDTDVTRAADVQRLVETALSAYGRIDVLVNNAAIGGGDDILATDEATWDRIVAVVLKSVFLCTRAVLPRMLEQRGGSIVNISSVNALTGLGEEAYSAAKAGVINLTQNLAIRYGQYGVRANVICPGTIRTPIWRQRVEKRPDVFDILTRWYPIGRVGEPEDVANATIFLASDEASFVTGAVLTVDGGLTAGMQRMARELQGD
jgi:meso-butanediol dehydrogenase / (S,S)-butanediol dehydrogenase / diacetyl reductase